MIFNYFYLNYHCHSRIFRVLIVAFKTTSVKFFSALNKGRKKHPSPTQKSWIVAEAVWTIAARRYGGANVPVPSLKAIGKKYGCNPKYAGRLALSALNCGELLRKKGSGRRSPLGIEFRKHLDEFLESINGTATYPEVC